MVEPLQRVQDCLYFALRRFKYYVPRQGRAQGFALRRFKYYAPRQGRAQGFSLRRFKY